MRRFPIRLSLFLFPFLMAWYGVVSAQTEDASRWTLQPNLSAGPVSTKSTEQELKRRYGAANVKDQPVYLGEGEFEPGTVLFPDDPQKKLEILWKDRQRKQYPREVRVGGVEAKTSVWRTISGISIGTMLKRLEQLNGRPFTLTGFYWDYSGTVVSWRDGALAAGFGSNESKWVFLRLDYGDKEPPEASQVVGDHEYSSGHPAMQSINPRVYQMLFVAPD
jgi:hypothetical protein